MGSPVGPDLQFCSSGLSRMFSVQTPTLELTWKAPTLFRMCSRSGELLELLSSSQSFCQGLWKIYLLIKCDSFFKMRGTNCDPLQPKCSSMGKILIPDNLVQRDGSIIVATFQLTLFLLNLFFFPPIYNQVFTFWFTVKQELLDKPEKLFSLKTFQNPTALISTCYSVIVRFKFSGKWASY